jgi:hypothetical protein
MGSICSIGKNAKLNTRVMRNCDPVSTGECDDENADKNGVIGDKKDALISVGENEIGSKKFRSAQIIEFKRRGWSGRQDLNLPGRAPPISFTGIRLLASSHVAAANSAGLRSPSTAGHAAKAEAAHRTCSWENELLLELYIESLFFWRSDIPLRPGRLPVGQRCGNRLHFG